MVQVKSDGSRRDPETKQFGCSYHCDVNGSAPHLAKSSFASCSAQASAVCDLRMIYALFCDRFLGPSGFTANADSFVADFL